MSRPIKFRAFDKQDNRMVYTDWSSFRNWYNESKVGKVVEARGCENEKLRFSEPMQFTGLHDKNGVEIWEGDVVYDEHQEFNGEIKYIEDGFYSVVCGVIENLGETHDQIEVIGNIYQNGDLLS